MICEDKNEHDYDTMGRDSGTVAPQRFEGTQKSAVGQFWDSRWDSGTAIWDRFFLSFSHAHTVPRLTSFTAGRKHTLLSFTEKFIKGVF